MNFKIAIPSSNRSKEINKKTIRFLCFFSFNINPKDIYVFVDKEEIEDYKKNNTFNVNIVEGKKGIKQNRKALSDYFDEGTYLLSMDDDIDQIQKLHINKGNGRHTLKRLDNLREWVESTIKRMKDENIYMAGLYPVENPFFMKNLVSVDCRFIIGNFRIFKNTKILENRKFTLLEDYETTMKYFFYCGKILRFNNLVASTKYKILKWGLNNEDKEKEVALFKQKYKDYSKIVIKSKTIDIRIKDCGFSVISSLWIGRDLNEISKMCIKSWIKNGYAVDLYVDKLTVNHFPDDLIPFINLIDYTTIENEYNNDDILPLSDYWRYNLLRKHRNAVWVDADMFLLDRLPNTDIIISSEHTFQSGAYKSDKTFVPNIGVIKFDNDLGQEFLEEIITKIKNNKEEAKFCDNMKVFRNNLKKKKYSKLNEFVYPPECFCGIPFWCCKETYTTSKKLPTKYNVDVKEVDWLLNNSVAIHLWQNFTYNKHKIDFYNIDENSLYNTLKHYY